MNPDNYIYAVLSKLGLQPTANRVNFMRAWAAHENTGAKNNPWATTWNAEPNRTDKYQGGYYYNYNNNYPVKNYSTFDIGVNAFVNTIKQGFYKNIYAGLVSGVPFDQWYNVPLYQEFSLYGGDQSYYNKLAALWPKYKNMVIGAGIGLGTLVAAWLVYRWWKG